MWQDYIKNLIKLTIAILGICVLALIFFVWVYPNKSLHFWNIAKTQFTKHKIEQKAAKLGDNDQLAKFQEGKHYRKLSAKITTHPAVQQFVANDPGKIQVIEFFSYACAWCQRLHPMIDQWVDKKPQNVAFYRFPIVFHAGWDKLAKAYYMVEKLGKNRELDSEFFTAIQQNNVNLADEKLLKDFFIRHGVSEDKYDEIYKSFGIDLAMKKGNEISEAFEVTLSPILIINTPTGSYLLLASMAGSEKAVMEILDYIIAKESKQIQSEIQ